MFLNRLVFHSGIAKRLFSLRSYGTWFVAGNNFRSLLSLSLTIELKTLFNFIILKLYYVIVYCTNHYYKLSLFSSHRKNWFATRCECLHLINKNSQCLFAWCEFFLIRCKYSQRAVKQFLRWLEKRLNTMTSATFVIKCAPDSRGRICGLSQILLRLEGTF